MIKSLIFFHEIALLSPMRKSVLMCILVAMILVVPACHRNRDIELTPEQVNLVHAYIELSRLLDTWPTDHPIYVESSQTILQTYGLTREAYETQIEFFNEDPARWEHFYAAVIERMEAAASDTSLANPETNRSRHPLREPNRSSEADRR